MSQNVPLTVAAKNFHRIFRHVRHVSEQPSCTAQRKRYFPLQSFVIGRSILVLSITFDSSITVRRVGGRRSSIKVSSSQRIFICKLSCICSHACPGLIHSIRVVTKQARKARGSAARDNQAGSFALLHARAFSSRGGRVKKLHERRD